MLRHILFYSLFSIVFTSDSFAQEPHHSKYTGQQNRHIKSLSKDDIAQIRAGKGWGLAKAAELNGVPGPSHILQMKEKIGLSKAQEQEIRRIYNEMQSQAIILGTQFVEYEKVLNDLFAQKSITTNRLRIALNNIAETRKNLRYTHLVAHLQTPKVLSQHQIQLYNQLRGYSHSGLHSQH